MSDELTVSGEPTITVTNEYGHVLVRKVFTRNGERLEITAPLSGQQIRLDAVALETLAFQTPETISLLLAEQP